MEINRDEVILGLAADGREGYQCSICPYSKWLTVTGSGSCRRKLHEDAMTLLKGDTDAGNENRDV